MKQIFIISIVLVISIRISAQEPISTSKLIPGCPKEIEFIQNQMNLSNMNYAKLSTGIDTLSVMFGEFTKNGNKDYWISLFNKDKLLIWTIVKLLADNETGLYSNNLDIKFDNSSKKISVKIIHNVSNGEIQYSWLDDNEYNRTVIIKSIDMPLQKGKIFPELKVETLNGDSISIKDLIGKFVVINWWATGCGPCRVEIPGLNSLVDKYKNNSNIVFLAIAFDKKEILENFQKSKEFKYIQTLGDMETSKLFGTSYPKHVILDKEGMISFYCEGGSEDRHLNIEEELKKIIKE